MPAGNDFVAIAAGYQHNLAVAGSLVPAEPMGTAFTYQGRLMDANDPADDFYDFEFKLYDGPSAGAQQGSTIDMNAVDVIDGSFTVELDFGSEVFAGDARWLEIGVRPGNSNDVFTTLSPRQELTPTPYALYAASAGFAASAEFAASAGSVGSADWSDLTNMPAGFADGTDNDSGGDITAVNAGPTLSGGGTSGDVTLNVQMPLDLSGSNTGGIIRGTNNYPSAAGIYGQASATSGTNYGGYFTAAGSTGRGVSGVSTGSNGMGVYGEASAASGTNYGVYGKTNSNSGYAGYFEGDVKVHGLGKGVVFPDGTKQTTAFTGLKIINIRRVQSTYLVPAHYSHSGARCDCPAGYTVLAGGWDAVRNEQPDTHDKDVHVYYDMPSGNGWVVGFRNDTGHWYWLKVYAICALFE